MVVGVRYQDPVGAGDGDVVRVFQLAEFGAKGSKLANKRAIGLEYL